MEHAGNWFLGVCAAVLAVGGLFVASHAGQGVGYYGGLLMFAFGVLFIMHLIKSSTGHGDGESHGH